MDIGPSQTHRVINGILAPNTQMGSLFMDVLSFDVNIKTQNDFQAYSKTFHQDFRTYTTILRMVVKCN